jgi:chromosomal replication initiation ATPase DnaA
MSQLAIAFPRRTALGRADFLVSPGNSAAVAWLDRWPDWPSGTLVLHGPPGCGKTHLVQLWREHAQGLALAGGRLDADSLAALIEGHPPGVAVDDADHADERTLLHLYNCCRERRIGLLLTAAGPPGDWAIGLADLRSRLRAAIAVGIMPPDDALLGAVLVKHFADRQLRVTPEVIAYLVSRLERSFAAAADIATRLDAAALAGGRAVTVPLARRILAEAQPSSLSPSGTSEPGVT